MLAQSAYTPNTHDYVKYHVMCTQTCHKNGIILSYTNTQYILYMRIIIHVRDRTMVFNLDIKLLIHNVVSRKHSFYLKKKINLFKNIFLYFIYNLKS